MSEGIHSSKVTGILIALLIIFFILLVWMGYKLLFEHQVAPVASSTQYPVAISPTDLKNNTVVVPSATSLATIPISIKKVDNSPTFTKTPQEIFPGFQTMVTLPNDILMPSKTDDTGIINSLAAFGGIGGGEGPCAENSSTFIEADIGLVLLCHFQKNDVVWIELIRPDKKVLVTKHVLAYTDYSYCFDRSDYQDPGTYQVRVSSDKTPIFTDTFEVSYSSQATVFTEHSTPGFMLSCDDLILEENPTYIFYKNFYPNEEVLIALYTSNGSTSTFDLVTTWAASMDENGNLIQYIDKPKLFSLGNLSRNRSEAYGLVVFGREKRKVRLPATDSFDATVAIYLIGMRGSPPATPIARFATITPGHFIATMTPSSKTWDACPGTYPSRLHIGDKAYVSNDPPLANRVRSEPDTNQNNIIGKIKPGEEITILSGPACSNNWIWWYVQSTKTGLVGWTSEGDRENYWLIPKP